MKTLLTILLIGYSTFSFSQSDFFKDRNPDLEIGINSNFELNTVEFGWNLKKENTLWGLINNAIILSSEFGTKNNQFLYVPKLTYSHNFAIINASINILNYNYSQNHSIYIRPQIGGTIYGLVDLVYGYNIPLSNRNQEFQGSILTLRIKLIETVKTVHLFSK